MDKGTKFARRDELEELHEKVDSVAEDVSYIKGKIEGISQQKKHDVTFYGMLVALVLGVWNKISG